MERRIFPTFEEIDKGYCTYEKSGRFRGVDDDGNPLYARSRYMEVVVAHNEYKNYIAIDIVLDHKYRRNGFRYGRLGKWRPYIFPYSQDGYNRMLWFIYDDLKFDKSETLKLLIDLEKAAMKGWCRMSRQHHYVKILPRYYIDVESGIKTFEVRYNDRNYKVGDILHLQEYCGGEYTGRVIEKEICYMIDNPEYCKEGFVVLGLKGGAE